MSCQGPKVYLQPYMIPGALPSTSSSTERYPVINIHDAEEYAAVEIDCSSEIDCCIVRHGAGQLAFACIGSPALGPLRAPIDILPWRRVMPYGSEAAGYTVEPLLSVPPLIGVKVHYEMPVAWQAKRAPFFRTAPNFPTGAAYAQAAEFPLFGAQRARVQVRAVNFSLTYKIEGAFYRARQIISEQAGDPIAGSSSGPDLTQLVLDGTGAVERTVAAGSVESIDIIEEPFDTLVISAKNGSGAATAFLTYRADP